MLNRLAVWGVILLVLGIWFPVGAQSPPPARVVVMPVTEKEIAPTSQMIGAVDFDRLSGVSPEVSGLIQSQSIEEGTVVRKGDILVTLNTEFVEKDIAILKKQVEQIDVKIANARKNANRFEELFKRSATSEKAYDDLMDSLREYQKQKEVVQSSIHKRELERKKSAIRAPYDGLILQKHKNEGEWVAPGSPVCTIAGIDDIIVKVAVPEALIRYVVPGAAVSLSIDAIDKKLTGKVNRIVPVADPASKTFQVKIAVPYMENLIQNMSVTINVPVSVKQQLRMIRRDALIRNQGKDFIYTVKDGKAKILPVTIAAVEGQFIGVSDPYIQAGMPVVVDGNDRLRPGQPVEAVEKENTRD